MIIGVDAGCLGITDDRLKVGVYRMSVNLLSEILKIDKKNFYKLYSFLPIDSKFLKNFGRRVENKVIVPSIGWMKIWLPLELKRNPVDVFLGLSQSLPRLPYKTKGIVFIHDLTFEKYPKWFENSYSKMSANTKVAVKEADRIVSVSKSTKNDLLKQFPNLNKNIIKVIYEGFDSRFKNKSLQNSKKIKEKFEIDNPFFLFVGTLKPSKNIPNIIRAFYKFIKSGYDYQLVICGSNYWMDSEINNLDLENKVKLLGFVSDDVLVYLYSNAELFVSPSFNEGFGLTYLEAAQFNLPIIASNKGSVFEVLGKGAYYVDPSSVEDICQAFEKIVTNKRLRDKLITLAKKNIKKFSWKKSAKQLLHLLKSYETKNK